MISLTVKKYNEKRSFFYECKAFFAEKLTCWDIYVPQVLCRYTDAKWVIQRINCFCFILNTALQCTIDKVICTKIRWSDILKVDLVEWCFQTKWLLKNPLTPANEKFADFRETSTACSSCYAEFRTFQIFEISLSVPKICEIFVFLFFNSARLFENLFSRKLQCLKYFLR